MENYCSHCGKSITETKKESPWFGPVMMMCGGLLLMASSTNFSGVGTMFFWAGLIFGVVRYLFRF